MTGDKLCQNIFNLLTCQLPLFLPPSVYFLFYIYICWYSMSNMCLIPFFFYKVRNKFPGLLFRFLSCGWRATHIRKLRKALGREWVSNTLNVDIFANWTLAKFTQVYVAKFLSASIRKTFNMALSQKSLSEKMSTLKVRNKANIRKVILSYHSENMPYCM